MTVRRATELAARWLTLRPEALDRCSHCHQSVESEDYDASRCVRRHIGDCLHGAALTAILIAEAWVKGEAEQWRRPR